MSVPFWSGIKIICLASAKSGSDILGTKNKLNPQSTLNINLLFHNYDAFINSYLAQSIIYTHLQTSSSE